MVSLHTLRDLAFASLVGACVRTPSEEVTLPVQHAPPARQQMTAPRSGELTLVEGCVRLDRNWLIVWPQGTTLDQADQSIRIVSGHTNLGVRVGERITISGHEERSPPSSVNIHRCAGPYWVVADGFARSAEISWPRVHATGAFSVRMPISLSRAPVEGIDSQFDLYEQSSLALGFDYGGVGCRAAEPRERAFTDIIDGRPVRFIREIGELPRPIQLIAVFPSVNRPRGNGSNTCLTVTAQCVADLDCDLGRAVIDTVRFDY